MKGLHYGHDNMSPLQRGLKRVFDIVVCIIPMALSLILWPLMKRQARTLYSVIKGDMSIVGPELLTIQQQNVLSEQTYDYLWLNDVKPGLISESRIYLPHDDSHLLDRVKMDLRYISNRTLLRDFVIIWDSIFKRI